MSNVIDFCEAWFKREQQLYENELDTPIHTTRREIEEIATDIVMAYADKYGFLEMLCDKLENELEEIENE